MEGKIELLLHLDENAFMNTEDKFIDIEKLFHEKNPSLARVLPGFVYSYIRRIIHQDEINTFLSKHHELQGIDFIDKVVEYFNIEYQLIGDDQLEGHKRLVFAANHPLGGLEGILISSVLIKKMGDIRIPVNDLLLSIKNFYPHFTPINKHGSNTRDAIREFDQNFASDKSILMFPAGYVSRRKHGIIRDIDWRKTFLSKAIEHKRAIVPVFITGRNSNFFYNLSRIRTLLGIKANLEMFFLPNELFKQKNSKISLFFGKPIPSSFFTKERNHWDWSHLLQDYIYQLKQNPEQSFEDYYAEKRLQ